MKRCLLGMITVVTLAMAGCGTTRPELQSRNRIPEPQRQYQGLKGQSAAVMVWADWRTRTDYPRIQLDLASTIQQQVEERLTPKKDKEEAAQPQVQFIMPGSVVRFQREHPEIEGQPITKVAPRLGVSRVIYVELENFQTHTPESIMLLRGNATATLRVVEVTNGQAEVVFEERDIEVTFPPDAPAGVVSSDKVNLRTIYAGTLSRLAEAVAVRFMRQEK